MNIESCIVAHGLIDHLQLPPASRAEEARSLCFTGRDHTSIPLVNLLLFLCGGRDHICIQDLNVSVLFMQLRRLKVKQVALMQGAAAELEVQPSIRRAI